MLKKLLLATTVTLAALTAVGTARADEHVCIGGLETQQAWGKYPKSISLGDCILSNLPSAEFEKIVKACGRPYDTTNRELPDNAHACRARTVATPDPYKAWVVTKVISAAPTTFAESRRAAEKYIEEQGLLPKGALRKPAPPEPEDAFADCLDLHGRLFLEGTLTYRIFPGSPNFSDVRRGDTPEPTFILHLAKPTCVMGDEFIDPSEFFSDVQVLPPFDEPSLAASISSDLRRMVGKRVFVEGNGAFGRNTGHHHAPLLLPITKVTAAVDPTLAYDTAMTTVQGFYIALGAGNGEEASKFVIPNKRASGPLSATAITRFYSNLAEPLTILDISALKPDQFLVRYQFVGPTRQRCEGASLVHTTNLNGMNLIDTIKAVNGC